ncbi:hypothetical protein DDB_G0269862 [Dictyostelium discoideum AX4]|uniref:Uncharacterized protein n=1 Tax=Dictyostelium discoideum TaxID=44689 RepID=Q55CX5_DICDI|nr:hypothetical protein DDB_G0269862 [Dictyostelium discoideum AX4]EAL72281.1 hypothetical protein DDB_G0269862 [Dictyostelium discoideum AX4]|eukprot:XP_646356.1 hypothetical protein DDB_G0269862 [Dictyostelium discoideum AX4]
MCKNFISNLKSKTFSTFSSIFGYFQNNKNNNNNNNNKLILVYQIPKSTKNILLDNNGRQAFTIKYFFQFL